MRDTGACRRSYARGYEAHGRGSGAAEGEEACAFGARAMAGEGGGAGVRERVGRESEDIAVLRIFLCP